MAGMDDPSLYIDICQYVYNILQLATYVKSLGIIADLTREIAVDAATISSELKMAMADGIILATTRAYNAPLWTQDADSAGIDGVQYVEKK